MDINEMTIEQRRELFLALRACVYGTNTNRKCVDSYYCVDTKGSHGGPYNISFGDAIETVLTFSDGLANEEVWPNPKWSRRI